MVRPTQQTSTKRKRQSNDLIWARDGDQKNAQEHPCYLLENCNEEGAPSDNDNDKVWVEWSSNGTVACIPKSRISTTGLSSRRSRRNDTKRPVVPSTKRSNNSQSKSKNNSTTATLNEDEDSESDDERIPDQILVEGCGISEVNGTYDRIAYKMYGSNSPVFNKKEIWKGEVKEFVIYECSTNTHCGQWYIGILERHTSLSPISFYFYEVRHRNDPQQISQCLDGKIPLINLLIPPVNGWTKIEHGVDPAPTLKYIYDAIDNSSSISDSIKKEDTTKVKEEMYGGETNNEEDKKIAAVPSLVSSSQLTKSAYDEDTDEDIAPDKVQSSQVKVKE